MKKHILADHPEITINFYSDPKFFHRNGFNQEDLEERVKKYERTGGQIIVVGENDTKCSVRAPEIILDKVQFGLKNYIGCPIRNIENIEIN